MQGMLLVRVEVKPGERSGRGWEEAHSGWCGAVVGGLMSSDCLHRREGTEAEGPLRVKISGDASSSGLED